jgi:hypothetical protein
MCTTMFKTKNFVSYVHLIRCICEFVCFSQQTVIVFPYLMVFAIEAQYFL